MTLATNTWISAMGSTFSILSIIGSMLATEVPRVTVVEMLNKAYSEAHSLGAGREDGWVKPGILGEIALKYAESGEVDLSQSTWHQAVASTPVGLKEPFLMELFDRAMEYKQYEKAIQVLEATKELPPLPQDADGIEKGTRRSIIVFRQEHTKGIAAICYAEQNDIARALEKVNQIDGKSFAYIKVICVKRLIVHYLNRGDSAGVLRMSTAFEGLENRDTAVESVTRMCANRGKVELAIRISEKIEMANSEKVSAFASISGAYLAAGDRDQSADWLKRAETLAKAIRYYDERRSAFYILAAAMAKAGNIEMALEYVNRIRELYPNRDKYGAHDQTYNDLFRICLEQEDIVGARHMYGRIKDRSTRSECRGQLNSFKAMKAIRVGDIKNALKIAEEKGIPIRAYNANLPRLAAFLAEAGEEQQALKLTHPFNNYPYARCCIYLGIAEGLSKRPM